MENLISNIFMFCCDGKKKSISFNNSRSDCHIVLIFHW